MNIDISSGFLYGDAQGLSRFMLDHRFVHDATAAALTVKFKVPTSTFGVGSASAERAWLELMRSRDERPQTPTVLKDWLELHAQIHAATYQLLQGVSIGVPDLSQVDFASEDQLNEWLYAHQSMHDFEQSQLGLV